MFTQNSKSCLKIIFYRLCTLRDIQIDQCKSSPPETSVPEPLFKLQPLGVKLYSNETPAQVIFS